MAISSVAIVGAGVAGLTAALSFARYGIDTHVIEQAHALSEVGAGLQLSPNATHILAQLGVLPEIKAKWQEPLSINLASGIHARNIVELPIAQVANSRWGAPYGTLHRATLQMALLHAVEREDLCHLHFGRKIDPENAESTISDIVGKTPDLIIGADGVWSKLRQTIQNTAPAKFSGTIAFRFTLPANDVPNFVAKGSVTAFLGPGAHLVAYPLNEVNGFNFVLLSDGESQGESWDDEVSQKIRQQFSKRMRNWHPEIRTLIDAVDSPRCWPLYEVDSPIWHNGKNMVLIGDAAHAMTPFAAQGAAMAIEDAFELAAITTSNNVLAAALAQFQAKRQPRIGRARKRAALNRFAYHARGPIGQARDLLLAFRPEKAFLADFDWLYGYRP